MHVIIRYEPTYSIDLTQGVGLGNFYLQDEAQTSVDWIEKSVDKNYNTLPTKTNWERNYTKLKIKRLPSWYRDSFLYFEVNSKL